VAGSYSKLIRVLKRFLKAAIERLCRSYPAFKVPHGRRVAGAPHLQCRDSTTRDGRRAAGPPTTPTRRRSIRKGDALQQASSGCLRRQSRRVASAEIVTRARVTTHESSGLSRPCPQTAARRRAERWRRKKGPCSSQESCSRPSVSLVRPLRPTRHTASLTPRPRRSLGARRAPPCCPVCSRRGQGELQTCPHPHLAACSVSRADSALPGTHAFNHLRHHPGAHVLRAVRSRPIGDLQQDHHRRLSLARPVQTRAQHHRCSRARGAASGRSAARAARAPALRRRRWVGFPHERCRQYSRVGPGRTAVLRGAGVEVSHRGERRRAWRRPHRGRALPPWQRPPHKAGGADWGLCERARALGPGSRAAARLGACMRGGDGGAPPAGRS
jgi:hypothetical protein